MEIVATLKYEPHIKAITHVSFELSLLSYDGLPSRLVHMKLQTKTKILHDLSLRLLETDV